MSAHRFVTLDVFTGTRFAGNPLAVVWDADELDDPTMLAVAREFGFSETVFLERTGAPGCDVRTRIWTPGGELPFAGHPTVGTAVALGPQLGPSMTFDQLAGPVAVEVDDGRATFTVDRIVELGPVDQVGIEQLAPALGLTPQDLVGGGRTMSIGNRFLAVEVASLEALGRIELTGAVTPEELYLFTRTGDDSVRARMLAPHLGIPEDPATGSAAAALAGLLAEGRADGALAVTVDQGVEMGRPSRIDVSADVIDGRAVRVRIGGAAVLVTDGTLHL